MSQEALLNHGNFFVFLPVKLTLDSPYRNTAPRHSFEFAFHVLQMHANLVIVSMAHLTTQEGRAFSRMPQEPDMDTLMDWVVRLEPLIRAEHEDEVIVVFANRCGTEDEAVYAGTSTVIGIQGGEVRLYGNLGRGDKELLVVDTNQDPCASLVYRPDTSVPGSKKRGTLHVEANTSTSAKEVTKMLSTVQSHDDDSAPASGMSDESGRLSQISTKAQPSQNQRRNREKLSLQTDSSTLGCTPADDLTVQTPTCPSPTPIALRPRITIPPAESLTFRYLSENGPVMYLQDKANSDTIAVPSISHTLPPPTPDAPASMYNQPIRILGGEVTLTRDGASPDTSISPNSMYHLSADASPFSPKFFWMPPSQLLETPIEVNGWRPPTTMSDATAFTDTSPITNRSNAPSALSNRNIKRDPKDNAGEKSKQDTAAESENQTVPRPSSPKSRNASRSRGPDRPGSAFDSTTDLDQIAQKLDEIAKRVDSAQSTRPLPGVSRGARAHSVMGISSTQLQYPEDSAASPRPTPNKTGAEEAGKAPTLPAARCQSSERPASRASARLPSAVRNSPRRTISRGRQPGSDAPGAAATPDAQSLVEPVAVVLDTPEHPIDLSEFRLIEEFRSPNCPVHGPRSNCKNQSVAKHDNESEKVAQATEVPLEAANADEDDSVAAVIAHYERPATISPGHAPFEPSTPKAMKLEFDLKSAPLVTESVFKLGDPNGSGPIPRPKSAVW